MLYRMATTGSPIFGLRREIDRLFEDTFARDGSSFTPAVDIKENDNEIRLDLELPGLKPEDVEITAENGVLSLHIPKAALPQPKRIEISAGRQTHHAAVGSGKIASQQSTGNVSSEQSTGKGSGRQSTGTAQREREGEMAAKNR